LAFKGTFVGKPNELAGFTTYISVSPVCQGWATFGIDILIGFGSHVPAHGLT
jgi:hypothetical protein